jgi:hypothetical protein
MQVISCTGTPILISKGPNFGHVFFSGGAAVTNSPRGLTAHPLPQQARPVPCWEGVLLHAPAMLGGVYVLPTASSVGKPGRAGLAPPWDRPALLAKERALPRGADKRDNGAGRPCRCRIGPVLAMTSLLSRADAPATSSSIATDKEDGTDLRCHRDDLSN